MRELVNLWFAEAGENQAFPLDDRSPLEIITTPRPQLASPRDRYTYFPDTAEVPAIGAGWWDGATGECDLLDLPDRPPANRACVCDAAP